MPVAATRRPTDRPAEMSTAGDAPSASAALGGTATRGRVVRCERRRRERGARARSSFIDSFFRHASFFSRRERVDEDARGRARARIGRERGAGNIVEIAREATVAVEAVRERRD